MLTFDINIPFLADGGGRGADPRGGEDRAGGSVAGGRDVRVNAIGAGDQ